MAKYRDDLLAPTEIPLTLSELNTLLTEKLGRPVDLGAILQVEVAKRFKGIDEKLGQLVSLAQEKRAEEAEARARDIAESIDQGELTEDFEYE